jgi:hypothetical protein
MNPSQLRSWSSDMAKTRDIYKDSPACSGEQDNLGGETFVANREHFAYADALQEIQMLREALKDLDALGGLGYTAHGLIRAALKGPK